MRGSLVAQWQTAARPAYRAPDVPITFTDLRLPSSQSIDLKCSGLAIGLDLNHSVDLLQVLKTSPSLNRLAISLHYDHVSSKPYLDQGPFRLSRSSQYPHFSLTGMGGSLG